MQRKNLIHNAHTPASLYTNQNAEQLELNSTIPSRDCKSKIEDCFALNINILSLNFLKGEQNEKSVIINLYPDNVNCRQRKCPAGKRADYGK